jgi:hAT family C-terminal dimerisation region
MQQQHCNVDSLQQLVGKFLSMEPAVQSLFCNVEQLNRLLLNVPCSNTKAERSFFTMRQMKAYLRNSMSQQRLNHVAVLNVHIERLDKLDLI